MFVWDVDAELSGVTLDVLSVSSFRPSSPSVGSLKRCRGSVRRFRKEVQHGFLAIFELYYIMCNKFCHLRTP